MSKWVGEIVLKKNPSLVDLRTLLHYFTAIFDFLQNPYDQLTTRESLPDNTT